MPGGGDGTVLVRTVVARRRTDGRVSVADVCGRALQEGKIVPVKITLKLLRNAMVGGWGACWLVAKGGGGWMDGSMSG